MVRRSEPVVAQVKRHVVLACAVLGHLGCLCDDAKTVLPKSEIKIIRKKLRDIKKWLDKNPLASMNQLVVQRNAIFSLPPEVFNTQRGPLTKEISKLRNYGRKYEFHPRLHVSHITYTNLIDSIKGSSRL